MSATLRLAPALLCSTVEPGEHVEVPMNVVMRLARACGGTLPVEGETPAGRLQLIVAALIASVVFSAVWGLAAGSGSFEIALGNLYKVPMVVLLSFLAAMPAGLVAWKLSGVDMRGTDLVAAFTSGVLNGALVLAVTAPVVALYYHSSSWAGPVLALGSVGLSIVVATFVFVRGVMRGVDRDSRAAALLPVLVIVVMHLTALLQLVAIASPILPETTIFDGGIDHIIAR